MMVPVAHDQKNTSENKTATIGQKNPFNLLIGTQAFLKPSKHSSAAFPKYLTR